MNNVQQPQNQLGPTLANPRIQATIAQATAQLRQQHQQQARMDNLFLGATRDRSGFKSYRARCF